MNKNLFILLFLYFAFAPDMQVAAQHSDTKPDSITMLRQNSKYNTWKPDFSNGKDINLLTAGILTQAWAIVVIGATGNSTPHHLKITTEGFLVGLAGWTAVAMSTNVVTTSIVYASLFGIPTALFVVAGTGVALNLISNTDSKSKSAARVARFQQSKDYVIVTDSNSITPQHLITKDKLPRKVKKVIEEHHPKTVESIYLLEINSTKYYAVELYERNNHDSPGNPQHKINKIHFLDSKGHKVAEKIIDDF